MATASIDNRIVAITVGAICAWLVLTLSLGDALIAVGRASTAAALPGNAPTLARVALGPMLVAGEVDMGTAVARRALRATPLVQPAIAWLAVAPAPFFPPRADRAALLIAANAQGWHDEYSQRVLYNDAVRTGNCPAALPHAVALLRQDLAVDTLENSLTAAARRPACQSSLLRLVASGDPWARRWLMRHGGSLETAQLIPLLAAIGAGQPGLPRDIAAAVLVQLASRGDRSAAIAVWDLVAGHDGAAATGRLGWPDFDALDRPTIFDWRLDDGYEVLGERPQARLVRAHDSVANPVVLRLLALPQGTYALHAAPAGRWWWDISCTRPIEVPARTLLAVNVFTVTAQCSQQWLALAANAPVGADLPELSTLRIDAAR